MDLQFILMHELGHVLGFADDTNPVDDINTIMTQGAYLNPPRYVQRELRNSFEALYGVFPRYGVVIRSEERGLYLFVPE